MDMVCLYARSSKSLCSTIEYHINIQNDIDAMSENVPLLSLIFLLVEV